MIIVKCLSWSLVYFSPDEALVRTVRCWNSIEPYEFDYFDCSPLWFPFCRYVDLLLKSYMMNFYIRFGWWICRFRLLNSFIRFSCCLGNNVQLAVKIMSGDSIDYWLGYGIISVNWSLGFFDWIFCYSDTNKPCTLFPCSKFSLRIFTWQGFLTRQGLWMIGYYVDSSSPRFAVEVMADFGLFQDHAFWWSFAALFI